MHLTARLMAAIPKAVLVALLLVAIGDMLVGVVLRYVVVAITDYFDWPAVNFFWVEEVGEFTLAWLTLIGAAIAIAERIHFSLNALANWLPAPMQRALQCTNHLLIAGFGGLVAIYGGKLSMINAALRSPALQINLAWLYGASVVGGGLMVIYALASALRPVGSPPDRIKGS